MVNLVKSTVKSAALLVLFTAVSITSCQQDSEVALEPQMPATEKSARLACLAQLLPNGANFTPGSVPMLAPVSSGTAEFNFGGDCDYFVAFQRNTYPRVVVATLNDAEVAQQIRRLISDAPVVVAGRVVGGGFGGSLSRARRQPVQEPTDDRVFVVIGEGRSNNYLSGLASARGTSVRSLLAKHLRLGNP